MFGFGLGLNFNAKREKRESVGGIHRQESHVKSLSCDFCVYQPTLENLLGFRNSIIPRFRKDSQLLRSVLSWPFLLLSSRFPYYLAIEKALKIKNVVPDSETLVSKCPLTNRLPIVTLGEMICLGKSNLSQLR